MPSSDNHHEHQSRECPSFPPLMYLELLPIYHDRRQSIPVPEAEKRNGDLLSGLDEFMKYIEREVDNSEIKPNHPVASCAFKVFKEWAEAGALTGKPAKYNRQGTIKRSEYLVGLNILAIKFKAAGFPDDQIIKNWLRTLNNQNTDFWRHSTNRGNLYIWSGAAAALFAIASHDSKAIKYQDKVWHHAISNIEPDGTIKVEMARGQRALIYHLFSFSATLVLRTAREALGYMPSPEDTAQLKSLADKIGATICNPIVMGKSAQAIIEMPKDWDYRIPIAFGQDVLNKDWKCCGRTDIDLWDVVFGGNTAVSMKVIKSLTP